MAALALLLATVGLYGVLAFTVGQRSHEIGVRMASGASPRSVAEMVVGQALAVAIGGIVVGAGGAVMVVRLVRTQLFGVSPNRRVDIRCGCNDVPRDHRRGELDSGTSRRECVAGHCSARGVNSHQRYCELQIPRFARNDTGPFRPLSAVRPPPSAVRHQFVLVRGRAIVRRGGRDSVTSKPPQPSLPQLGTRGSRVLTLTCPSQRRMPLGCQPTSNESAQAVL